jgi:hypothetical protein
MAQHVAKGAKIIGDGFWPPRIAYRAKLRSNLVQRLIIAYRFEPSVGLPFQGAQDSVGEFRNAGCARPLTQM